MVESPLNRQVSRLPGLFPGIHYAWIIIAIAAVLHMAGGSVRQAFGVLVVPLQQDMGWSPASITLAYALGAIIGAAMAPLSGIATDRFGARKVIFAGILFFFLGAIITGATRSGTFGYPTGSSLAWPKRASAYPSSPQQMSGSATAWDLASDCCRRPTD